MTRGIMLVVWHITVFVHVVHIILVNSLEITRKDKKKKKKKKKKIFFFDRVKPFYDNFDHEF